MATTTLVINGPDGITMATLDKVGLLNALREVEINLLELNALTLVKQSTNIYTCTITTTTPGKSWVRTITINPTNPTFSTSSGITKTGSWRLCEDTALDILVKRIIEFQHDVAFTNFTYTRT